MAKVLKTSWTWNLKTPPARLWPAVSYTERFNKVIGMPEPVFTDTPHEGGGSVRTGVATRMGLEERWREHPYEWVEPHRYQVVRDYEAGLLTCMVSRMLLRPSREGGSELTFELELTPRHFIGHGAALVETQRLRRVVGAVYQRIDRALQTTDSLANLPVDYDPYENLQDRLQEGHGARLVQLLADTQALPDAPREALQRIADLIRLAPDHVVERMRPWQLARRWRMDRDEALDAFLLAARTGMVDLAWSVLCPNCRAESEDVTSLGELTPDTHCGACNINFATEFTESVELTFRPGGAIRPVTVGTYCIGGPGSAPDSAMQQWLQPGERRELELTLPSGTWRLFGARIQGQRYLDICETGQDHLSVTIDAAGLVDVAAAKVACSFVLTLHNDSPWDQVFRIDRASWRDDAVTAAVVTSRASFRKWFSTEVLSPGCHVDVGKVAVLFTDLQGSTRLYEAVGDGPAYARVREHFTVLRQVAAETGGTVVKTIGDAIMAVWSDPLAAVKAALRFQDALEAEASCSDLVVKVGLHHGRCIGVNLNNIMDYFGTTVNHAARLERVAGGGEVALSEAMATEPVVAQWLAQQTFTSRREVDTELKGLQGTHRVLVLGRRSETDALE